MSFGYQILPHRYPEAAPAGPTTYVEDTFTDTNGTELVDHTPDTDTEGGGWSSRTATTDGGRIQANVYENEHTSREGQFLIDAGVADCVVRMTLNLGDNTQSGMYVRYSDSSNFWQIRVRDDTQQVILYRVVAGSFNADDTQSATIANNTDYDMVCTLSGNSVSCDVAGVTVSATNSHNNTATSHGFWVRKFDTGTAEPYVDDFSVKSA